MQIAGQLIGRLYPRAAKSGASGGMSTPSDQCIVRLDNGNGLMSHKKKRYRDYWTLALCGPTMRLVVYLWAGVYFGTFVLLAGPMPWHNTQLAGIWRESIWALAQANDAARAQQVFAWRAADRQPLGNLTAAAASTDAAQYDPQPAYQACDQTHNQTHVARLCDFVHFLIWQKLCRQWNGHPPDRFLGVTDLKEYLLAQGYAREAVDQFINTLGPPFPCGDLRFWLCGSRHRYTDQQLDCHLLQNDIEELRRTKPQLANQSDAALMKLVPRGLGARIWTWAKAMTFSLVTGDCNCPDMFATPETAFRGYHAAEKRCRKMHFLSALNLVRAKEESEEGGTDYSDPLSFVERAVTGSCIIHQHPKGFAQSMFCIVYDTPGDASLRLGEYNGHNVLTEAIVAPSGVITVGHGRGEEGSPHEYVCFGCPKCNLVVSPEVVRKCRRENHPWVWGKIVSDQPLEGEWFRVGVNACQAQHVWPKTREPTCPVCQHQVRETNKMGDIFAATKLDFGAIIWSWTAAELQPTCI